MGHAEAGGQAAQELKARLRDFWDSYQPYWDSLTTEASIQSQFREKAISFIPEGSRVLDAACGGASNAHLLSARGCKYFGVDLSQLGLRSAIKSGLQLVCGDAEKLPFPSATFQACISTFALEHSANPVRMLEEMCRTVQSGGRIVLLGPSWDFPFWYPSALQSRVQNQMWRVRYFLRRLLRQMAGWWFGRLPFEGVPEPDVFGGEFAYDSDAVYIVWSYEVIRQMERWGCRLVHSQVDDRLLGTNALVRGLKHLLVLLPPYRLAGSTVLLVFEV